MTNTSESEEVERKRIMPEGYADAVKRLGQVGVFAPGEYLNACRRCRIQFWGDKRSLHCLPCAVSDLSRRPAAPSVGWKVVPVEPTEAMLDASWEHSGESREMRLRYHARMRRHWAIMHAAAPDPSSQGGGDRGSVGSDSQPHKGREEL